MEGRFVADGAGSLMARLKEATRDLHRYAESRSLQVQMFRGEVDKGAFAAYLGQLYLVHLALEAALAKVAEARPAVAGVARADRPHADRLRDDLDHHGLAADSIVPCAATRRLVAATERREREEPLSLLGQLYVLEGSTNGAKVLARVLSRAWRTDGAGLSSLDPYGDAQSERWSAFKQGMDALGLDEQAQAGLVEAARETFLAIADISDQVAGGLAARTGGSERTEA
jgi:heme oxygenase